MLQKFQKRIPVAQAGESTASAGLKRYRPKPKSKPQRERLGEEAARALQNDAEAEAERERFEASQMRWPYGVASPIAKTYTREELDQTFREGADWNTTEGER